MATKLTASFDELLRSRYGDCGEGDKLFELPVDELLGSYYGLGTERVRARQKRNGTSVVLSVSDDGETLRSKRRPRGSSRSGTRPQEYVVQQSMPAASAEEAAAIDEYRVDVLDPIADVPPRRPAFVTPPPRAAAYPVRPSEPAPPMPPAAGPPGADIAAQEDDFMADMKSILSGQSTFDAATKKTVDRAPVARRAAHETSAPAMPAPDTQNRQAIFDRIAQSMTYANAYNLGTMELANRFADFDKTEALEEKAKRQPAKPMPRSGPAVDNADFVRDLDAIRTSQAQSRPQPYAEPLFDTGEHVRFASDMYPERLRVGSGQGVLFSYGQIIAMGDFYESVDQMMNASAQELQGLKTLIEQSTAFYTTGQGTSVGTESWEQKTGGRYLRLAENNYEHFSPPPSLAGVSSARRRHGDNKSGWEKYHRQAIEEAQKLFLSQGNTSALPEYPLIINAFGDHFLTDAFASGHLINKEAMINTFKSKFLSGNSLTSAGGAFFDKVAEKAFVGDVARKFSALETVDYPVCAWGWCFKWRPNIDGASMFARLLKAAAEHQPDRIANLAVKALHDHLNKEGIQVTNDAGDGTWILKGDEHLNDANLTVVRKAVQQSIDNINDPSIRAGNLNFGPFFTRVWKHVPKPTASSLQTVSTLAARFHDPDINRADGRRRAGHQERSRHARQGTDRRRQAQGRRDHGKPIPQHERLSQSDRARPDAAASTPADGAADAGRRDGAGVYAIAVDLRHAVRGGRSRARHPDRERGGRPRHSNVGE